MVDGYGIRPARPADLPGVARVFAAGFPATIAHYFGGRAPSPEVLAEPFALCLAAEPEGFWVATAPGEGAAGYIVAPARAGRLWRVAVTDGYAARWLAGWVTGRMELGWAPVRALAGAKVQFWRAMRLPGCAADARILSVAVDPAHQGRGLAGQLCALAVERFDRLGVPAVRLEVRPDNGPAVRIYSKLGFAPAGETRDGQGAWLVMLRRPPRLAWRAAPVAGDGRADS